MAGWLRPPFGMQRILAVVALLLAAAPPGASGSTPVAVGYRDHSYGNVVTNRPTGEKPQSKLWWHDGSWWGCLWQPAVGRYRVHRFDWPTQSWVDVGPDVDNRSQALVDALWDGQRLYIAAHPFDTSGTFLLFSYTYDAGTRTWLPRSGFPATMGSGSAEALTIDKDSSGKLWITWEHNGNIYVNRSTTADNAWGSAFILPVQGSSVSSDDISAVAAFGGRIGIAWTNQKDAKIYFATHVDGAADTSWQPREQALGDATLGAVADDHVNLKVLSDGGANVYAVTKTSLQNPGDPLIYLLRRDPNGIWTRYVVGRKEDQHTRPIVLIDTENRKIYVFAQSDDGSNGIRMKVSDLDNISFPVGAGTAFIQSSSDPDVNDASSTKQNLNGTTNLLVIASDEVSHYYFHNTIDLPTASATPDIAVTPSVYSFGNVTVGQSASATFQVRNTGTANLNVTSTTLVGTNAAEFAITSGGGAFSLSPGGTRNLTVRFGPTSLGTKTAALRIASNDPDENPFDAALSGTGISAGPDIAVSPTSRDYGQVVLGTSASQTFQLRNDGSADLHVSSTSLTGANPSQFAIQSGGGSFTLAPAATRDVVVDFVPTSLGAKSATLRLASDDPDENPLDVGLVGTAVLPDIAVTPLAQSYGDVILNTAVFHTVEVRNSGTGSLDVSSTALVGTDAAQYRIDAGGGGFSLSPGQTQQVTVSLRPTSLGPKSANLRFASNDPDESALDVPLTGNGASSPPGGGTVVFEESVTGSSSSVPTVSTSTAVTGASGRLYLAVISTRALVAVSGVSGLGLVWTRVDAQCGGRGTTGVEIWMGQGTPATGTVTADLAASPKTAVIAVSRYSGAAAVAPVGSIASGNSNGVDGLCTGGTDAASYSVPLVTTLYGAKVFAGVATVNRTHTPGTGYTQRGALRAGKNSSAVGIAVMDRPLLAAGGVWAAGTLSGTADYAVVELEIRPGSPIADIAVAPPAFDYGSVVVGTSAAQTFQVRNDGTADLHVTSTNLVGTNAAEFGIDSGGGAFTLTGGGTHDIGVHFSPSGLGTRSAALRITSDDPDEGSVDVVLAGNGVATAAPEITLSPSAHDYGNVVVGTTATQTFQVRNDGAASLDVTSTSLVGPNAAEFALQSGGGAFTLAAGATHDLIVAFHPTATGARSSTLRIASNDPDENPLDAALTGTGTTPPPITAVVCAGTTSGGSVSSTTVSTAVAVPAVSGQLYLAAIAPKNYKQVVGVSGMGLVWTRVQAQCGGRSQTGVEVWIGRGTPTDGPVTATLAEAPNAAVLIVSRYSGADPAAPLGNTVGANTLGVGGLCAGGVDGTVYAVPLATGANGAVAFGAVAMRHKELTPGATWTQRDLVRAGSSGSMAGLAVLDRGVATAGSVVLDGTFNEPVDWAVLGVEIRPAGAAKPADVSSPASPPQSQPVIDVAEPGLDVRSGVGAHAPWIRLASPAPARARVDLYDSRGRLVRTLLNGTIPAGRLVLEWQDAVSGRTPAGVYFVRAQVDDRELHRKLLILR